MSAANTGSAAHLLGAKCLRSGMEPSFYRGARITPVEEPHSLLGASGCERWLSCPGSIEMAGTHPENRQVPTAVTVDGRMVSGVEQYCTYVWDLGELHGSELYVEKTFGLEWVQPGMFGTSDAVVINHPRREAWVIDYKNGAGEVEAEWNSQLLYYALGALHGVEGIDFVNLVIVQPNVIGETIKEFRVSLEEIRAWGVEVLRPAAVAAQRKSAPRHPGDHCKFCPGQKHGRCPELKHMLDRLSMNVLTTGNAVAIENATAEQKIQLIEHLEMLVSMAKRAKENLTFEAEQGTFSHPDWKLVKGRSNRRWRDDAEGKLVQMFGSEVYKSSLKGFGDIEKLMKGRGYDPKTVMPQLTEKPFGGYQLVKAGDPRPAEEPIKTIDLLN